MLKKNKAKVLITYLREKMQYLQNTIKQGTLAFCYCRRNDILP